MAVAFAYPADGVDTGQLHDELLRAGVAVERVERGAVTTQEEVADGQGNPHPVDVFTPTVWVVAADGQQRAPVDAVVAAHVPQARYDPPTRLAEVAALRAAQGRRSAFHRARAAARGAADADGLRAAVLLLTDLVEKETSRGGDV